MSAPITTEHKRRLEAQGVGAPKKFPVLAITHDSLKPEGAFAEAQAVYLNPVQELVKELDALLTEKKIGICAHFYMGPELQGVLSSCKWPHIFVADSLAMADAAIEMAKAGVEAVVVLGVDFMSENVRAQMDFLGCEHVPVYRVRTEEIGCSLAESADQPAYGKYLLQAANQANSLHVVYINTGLLTKAKAHAVVPTITCTSSNVVKLVLQVCACYHEVQKGSSCCRFSWESPDPHECWRGIGGLVCNLGLENWEIYDCHGTFLARNQSTAKERVSARQRCSKSACSAFWHCARTGSEMKHVSLRTVDDALRN